MKTSEVIFFENESGAIAVSIDGGDTLFNSAGRRLSVDEDIWEECDSDVSQLSAPCKKAAEFAFEKENDDATLRANKKEIAEEALGKKLQEKDDAHAEKLARHAASILFYQTPEGRRVFEEGQKNHRLFMEQVRACS